MIELKQKAFADESNNTRLPRNLPIPCGSQTLTHFLYIVCPYDPSHLVVLAHDTLWRVTQRPTRESLNFPARMRHLRLPAFLALILDVRARIVPFSLLHFSFHSICVTALEFDHLRRCFPAVRVARTFPISNSSSLSLYLWSALLFPLLLTSSFDFPPSLVNFPLLRFNYASLFAFESWN